MSSKLGETGTTKLGGLTPTYSPPLGDNLNPEQFNEEADLLAASRAVNYFGTVLSHADGAIAMSGISNILNNQHFEVPYGPGATVIFEFQVDGTYVPVPGRTTIDISGVGNAFGLWLVMNAALATVNTWITVTQVIFDMANYPIVWTLQNVVGGAAGNVAITSNVAPADFFAGGFANGGLPTATWINVDGATKWLPFTKARTDLYGSDFCRWDFIVCDPSLLNDNDSFYSTGYGTLQHNNPHINGTGAFELKLTGGFSPLITGSTVIDLSAAANVADVASIVGSAIVGITNWDLWDTRIDSPSPGHITLRFRFQIPGLRGEAQFSAFTGTAPADFFAMMLTPGIDDLANVAMFAIDRLKFPTLDFNERLSISLLQVGYWTALEPFFQVAPMQALAALGARRAVYDASFNGTSVVMSGLSPTKRYHGILQISSGAGVSLATLDPDGGGSSSSEYITGDSPPVRGTAAALVITSANAGAGADAIFTLEPRKNGRALFKTSGNPSAATSPKEGVGVTTANFTTLTVTLSATRAGWLTVYEDPE